MSSGLLVPPNVGVDRLVADRELAVKAQVATEICSGLQSALSFFSTRAKSAFVKYWFRRDRERRPFVLSMALLGR